jgi:hypothetical protein
MNRDEKRNLAIVLALAFLASLVWCLTKGLEIAGDDAIMGLMALKISQGAEFPIFFWQAHYSGPIASYLAAPLHWFFDPSPLVLHSIIIPIHMSYSTGVYFLARSWLGQREAVIAGLLAALPAQLFPYSALGGFTESMAFVPWIFLLCLGESKDGKSRLLRFLCGGFLCGFALWVFPLAFPMVLACLLCQYKAYGGKAVKLSLAGCLLGLLPAIYHNISQPGATLLRLFARPSALDRQTVSQMVSSEGIISFFLQLMGKWAYSSYDALLSIPRFTVSLLGFAPDATVWGLITGFITCFALLFGLRAFFRYQGKAKAIPLAMLWTVVLTYCFLVFFGLNRDRYLIPILLIIPFGLALSLQRIASPLNWLVGSVAVAALLLLNGLANFWNTEPPYPDYQGLARFLQFNGLISGYASYTTAYPLVYLSNERLIYTPAFDDSQYDRHAEYTARVSRAEKPTFVFSDQRSADRFRRGLRALNTSSKERAWGPFSIFHDLSPQVNIERLRSATATPPN